MFPSFLLLEYRTREELELMPQTKEEHIQDLEASTDSDSDSSSDSSSDHGGSVSSSRHSVKSTERHRQHSFTTHVPPPTAVPDHSKVCLHADGLSLIHI